MSVISIQETTRGAQITFDGSTVDLTIQEFALFKKDTTIAAHLRTPTGNHSLTVALADTITIGGTVFAGTIDQLETALTAAFTPDATSVQPKVYRALINQSGTANPVITEVQNNTGINFNWTRFQLGWLVASMDVQVPKDKVFVLATIGTQASCFAVSTAFNADPDANFVELKTFDNTWTLVDIDDVEPQQAGVYIMILIYP